METIYISLIIILIAFNLFLTLIVLNNKYLESYKKTGMLILIWLVPLFGLIWVYIMFKTKNDQNGNNNDPLMYSWFDSSSHNNFDGTNDGGDSGGD